MRMIREAWGKTDRDGGGVHPLAHHCMDVAAVFGRMMELPIICNRLETAAKAPLSDVDRRRLAALVFLHDIGKLHPGFQAKGWLAGSWSGPVRGHSKEAWAFLMLALKRHEHPFHETMQRIMGWGEAVSPLVAAMIAHHGRPVEQPSDPTLRDWDSPSSPHYDWRSEARVMDDALHRWFASAFKAGYGPLPDRPQFHHAVAGLVALADWVGSDRRFFDFAEPFNSEYNDIANRAAAEALAVIGLDPGALAAYAAPGAGGIMTVPDRRRRICPIRRSTMPPARWRVPPPSRLPQPRRYRSWASSMRTQGNRSFWTSPTSTATSLRFPAPSALPSEPPNNRKRTSSALLAD